MKNVEELVPVRKGETTLDRLRSGKARDLLNLSYEELLARLQEEGEIVAADMAGDGYVKPPDNRATKRRLVGVPFILVDWRKSPGKFGPMFSLRVRTAANEKLILIDGSTGIAAQMEGVQRSGYIGAIWCKNGLTRSEYPVIDRDEAGNDVTCSACRGLRMIDPAYEEPVPGRKICDACEGTGAELMRDADGNVMRGETFYLDVSA